MKIQKVCICKKKTIEIIHVLKCTKNYNKTFNRVHYDKYFSYNTCLLEVFSWLSTCILGKYNIQLIVLIWKELST